MFHRQIHLAAFDHDIAPTGNFRFDALIRACRIDVDIRGDDFVDDLYGDYQQRGAIIRQPPTNFLWGVREMNVEDPDGHRLRIGSDATGPGDNTSLNEAS